MQAADEEELVHLQSLLAQSQAAEAEAIRRASEVTQKLAATSAQSVHQTETEFHKVTHSETLLMTQLHTVTLFANL